MTSHAARLYALALTLVVFFLALAVVAARPWASSRPDARLRALAAREAQLRREGRLVQAVVAQRQAAYRARLAARQSAIRAARVQAARRATSPAAAPAAAAPVRIVTLPPLTITRTS